ncbi:hypothetical protein BV25DRAFT_938426 [Artomyces pyxidatus]|uniref:Uncharacterized protein n=1 Tax=Artomyces pyxidatus TaxID=48021 RepID=A0ACB8SXD7_9AGAM|nr:hypothetical protein BV25DRAFT_938426 [Artomyces pyxidatus]
MGVSSPPKHGRKIPGPLLLEFPTPPTFIPTSPFPAQPQPNASRNPPPSLPPSTPLPPLPGPSPISEEELIYISSTSRSRRASRISTNSRASSPGPSARDSTVSVSSTEHSVVPSSPTASTHTFGPPAIRNRTESLTSVSGRSIRSFSSAGSLNVPPSSYAHPATTKSPPLRISMDEAILEDEEYHSPTNREGHLTHLSLADIPRATPSPQPPPSAVEADESISSINMHDLPALQDDDGAALLHFEMRTARSKSEMHKSRLRRGVPRKASGTPRSAPPSAFPSRSSAAHDSDTDRPSSPDIASIIAATPRPRRPSETSSARGSLPGSRRTSGRRQSGGSVAVLAYRQKDDDEDSMWNEDSFVEDYGVVIKGGDPEAFAEVLDVDDLDAEAEEAAEDSDSSLDLHTPLPNLMLRDGLLSPHSKILPQNLRSDSPMVLGGIDGDRPGSIMSIASTSMTKSGVFKDERDTVKRRVRHRDGRLLRGGIGLTTGLGWSDSEDEDAPSPLTKRLSHLALSRKSSSSSLGGARPTPSPRPHVLAHPLSRSFSSDSARLSSRKLKSAENPDKSKGRSSLPPTSWPKRAPQSSAPPTPQHSEPPSPRISIPPEPPSKPALHSMSSTSTLSIPAPVTPADSIDAPMEPLMKSDKLLDREKSLPPLPLSRGPSNASMIRRPSFSRMRPPPNTINPNRSSAGSDSSDSIGGTMGHDVPMTPSARSFSSTLPSRSTPRPLHLTASLSAGLQPGEPATKQGLLLGYNRQLHDQQRARAASGPAPVARRLLAPSPGDARAVPPVSPNSDGGGEAKPRPRTGTGMVYKRSSGGNSTPQMQSRMRMPAARTGSAVAS